MVFDVQTTHRCNRDKRHPVTINEHGKVEMRTRRVVAGAFGLTVVAAAALSGTLRRFEIKEASMSPTLEPGDWVIARRMSRPPDRGDIVVFNDPTGTGMNLVKRVIGLEDETLTVKSGRVLVDGAVLADRWANGATVFEGSWIVPQDYVWVLGDNRGDSRSDGRTIGTTPVEEIGWRVVARYWPTSNARSLT